MRVFAQILLFLAAGSLLLAGCDSAPGRPAKGSETIAPDEILDFNTLFSENCAGCHGANGRGGAAIALADPVYLAIVNQDTLRKVITNGIKGTSMAAFGQSAGGMLTSKQIDVLAAQICARWSKPGILGGVTTPSYAAKTPGDVARGALTYPDLLRVLSRRGRPGQREGKLHHRWFLPRSPHRSGIAHHGDCRSSRPRTLPIGATMCRANPCPIRKSPMS